VPEKRAAPAIDQQREVDDERAASDDRRLVVAAQRDPREFAALYQRYADRVFRYALQRTGSPAVADDILGETMMAAFEGLPGYSIERGSFSGWLFTIAARRLADRHRRRSRFWRAVTRGSDATIAADDVLDTIVRREDAQRVTGAIGRLNESDADLLLLRYSAGLNSSEIAAVTGLSPGAVRMRLSRARRELAKDLRIDG
jgi:RNA polymerase sigma-70 factor (ECF subfamily)